MPLLPDAIVAATHDGTGRGRIAFDTRDSGTFFYPNSQWKTPFVGGDWQWLLDGGLGGRNLDARTFYFYVATVNTPAMAAKMVGAGSQYALANRDKDGNDLDGGKNYRLHVPANVPAKDLESRDSPRVARVRSCRNRPLHAGRAARDYRVSVVALRPRLGSHSGLGPEA